VELKYSSAATIANMMCAQSNNARLNIH